jgi:hypothetical protein
VGLLIANAREGVIMRFEPTGRTMAVVGGVVALLVVIGVSFALLGGSSGPISPTSYTIAGANGVTTSTGNTTPVTNAPSANGAVSKDEAIFIDQDVALSTFHLLHGSHVITQRIVDQAMAGVPGSKGMTATVVAGKVTLKMKVSLGGQTSYACATFSGTSISREPTILASCP